GIIIDEGHAMKYAASAAILVAGLWAHCHAQDKPAPRAVSIASFDLRACFDKENVAKLKDLDLELQANADEAARILQRAPEQREKLRSEYLALYDLRKLEIYLAIDKVCAALAKERGYTAIM